SCTPIDETGGSYNNEGHSPFYGYGRPDAGRAMALAAATGNTESVPQLRLQAEASGTLTGSGDERGFSVNLSSAAQVDLDGPDGVDFDIYVKRGVMPAPNDFDFRAYTTDSNETLIIEPNTPGEYFILVKSYKGGGDFKLRVEQV
ncbi:MAG: hypothetical protein GY705_31665, partial [Bacteroidetes bacterium]|nr:hypothetical protein [Bacteroidota bacterium]